MWVLIGVLLIVTAARGGKTKPSQQLSGPQLALDTLDTPVNDERLTGHSDDGRRDVEAQLSRMIEADPDAAAKVIQNWIRDAASDQTDPN